MGCIHKVEISSSNNWQSIDLVNSKSWIIRCTDQEIVALDVTVRAVEAKGLEFPNVIKSVFSLNSWTKKLQAFANELENGRGFLLTRGLPVYRYTAEDTENAYYGIGLHMGCPVQQKSRGDLLGVVMNIGDAQDKNTPIFETNIYLPYHTDSSDAVGLLCICKAERGGVSSLSSIGALHNKVVKEYPEFLVLLCKSVLLCTPWSRIASFVAADEFS